VTTDEAVGSMQFGDYMAGMDALMWRVQQDPMMRSGTVSVMELDRKIDPDLFRAKVRHVVAQVPRLRQVVVQSGLATAPPRFVDAPYFDLEYHTPVMGAEPTGRRSPWRAAS